MILPECPKVKGYIYLDHNASSPTHPEVLRAMERTADFSGNPSALHQPGQQLRGILNQARMVIQDFVGAHKAQLVFTSGATESNYWILQAPSWRQVILSPFEHPSLSKNIPHTTCAINEDGFINICALNNILQNSPEKTLVSIQMANSESGFLLNMQEVVRVVRAHGAYIHSDATQAFGRIPINFADLDLDAMTVAAHKSGGPKGIGALIVKNPTLLADFIKGGSQEFGFRAGTENTLGIVGFAQTCEHINWQHNSLLRQWHKDLESTIAQICPKAVVLDTQTPRLPNTSLLYMPGKLSTMQTIYFDLKKIAIGTGVSCSSGTSEGMAFLRARNFSHNITQESVRVSSGWSTTQQDLLTFTQEWITLFKEAQKTH